MYVNNFDLFDCIGLLDFSWKRARLPQHFADDTEGDVLPFVGRFGCIDRATSTWTRTASSRIFISLRNIIQQTTSIWPNFDVFFVEELGKWRNRGDAVVAGRYWVESIPTVLTVEADGTRHKTPPPRHRTGRKASRPTIVDVANRRMWEMCRFKADSNISSLRHEVVPRAPGRTADSVDGRSSKTRNFLNMQPRPCRLPGKHQALLPRKLPHPPRLSRWQRKRQQRWWRLFDLHTQIRR